MSSKTHHTDFQLHEYHRKVPYGIRFIRWLGLERITAYRGWVLILTFFAYTTYHLSRKPISVVKGTLNPNCSKHASSCHGWSPFGKFELVHSLIFFQILQGAQFLCFSPFFFCSSFSTTLFSGLLAEHMDLRHFLTVGMLASGLFSIAFGLGYFWNVHYFAYFVVVQILSGFCQSSGWPSVVECVGNWFGKGRRGLIMGIWNSHTSVGNILGSTIAGIWASHKWGYSFIVPGCIISGMGIIVFLFLVVVLVSLCEKIVLCFSFYCLFNSLYFTQVESEEKEGDILKGGYIDNSTSVKIVPHVDSSSSVEISSASGQGDNAHAITFWRAVLIPGVIEYSLCLFFAKLVSYTFLFWLPFYIEHTPIGGKKYGPRISADLSTLFDVGGIIGGILAGYISDKKECSGITVVVMLIIAAPMVSASTLVYSKELGVARVGGFYSIWNSCGKYDLSYSKKNNNQNHYMELTRAQ
ncbi:PREDICTED: sugar phosphate exchanger 2-like [Acropora digitifera]|uniref:sugar phosphate exchanger 2-like n=1 Tax=Acropora digitifera TaxID=70779 RepID=UPI00077A4F04|nr:PREDICTED: sugar phosphate exchanger 2-like [Acropora digitifera]